MTYKNIYVCQYQTREVRGFVTNNNKYNNNFLTVFGVICFDYLFTIRTSLLQDKNTQFEAQVSVY